MTAYATRPPLQLINNPHMMSEARGHGRRTSKRLEEKEDAPLINGFGHESELVKGSQKENINSGKTKINGVGAKSGAKRKPSEWIRASARLRQLGLIGTMAWKCHLFVLPANLDFSLR